jgi:hypothetical protein
VDVYDEEVGRRKNLSLLCRFWLLTEVEAVLRQLIIIKNCMADFITINIH